MAGFSSKLAALAGAVGFALCCRGVAQTPAPPCEVLISVADQRLALVCNGELVARFPVSTSRFGTGDNFGSYKTPLGQFRVCDKLGENLSSGAVIKHRSATGEVIPVNAPGRDTIVTRVVGLDGLEEQNRNARGRGIYIHGTPEEVNLGKPVSWGCIRMRSKDVIQLCQQIPVGAMVSILPDKLPHMHRYEPPREEPVAPKQAPAPVMIAVTHTAPPVMAASHPEVLAKPVVALRRVAARPELPAIAEEPSSSSSSAMQSMKGSILLANLPDESAPKVDKLTASIAARRWKVPAGGAETER